MNYADEPCAGPRRRRRPMSEEMPLTSVASCICSLRGLAGFADLLLLHVCIQCRRSILVGTAMPFDPAVRCCPPCSSLLYVNAKILIPYILRLQSSRLRSAGRYLTALDCHYTVTECRCSRTRGNFIATHTYVRRQAVSIATNDGRADGLEHRKGTDLR